MLRTAHDLEPVPLNEQTSGTLNVSESFASLPGALALILALGAVDWTWAEYDGLTFVGWTQFSLVLICLGLVFLVYSYFGRDSRLGDAGYYAFLWVAFSATGVILTYLAATLCLPLRDSDLSQIDRALGFDWAKSVGILAAHRWVLLAAGVVYNSMLPQIVASILYFAHIGRSDRNREFLWLGMTSLLITTVISGLVPAVGPYSAGEMPHWSKMLLTIRSGTETRFTINEMQGIIAMPSFHTVLAAIFVYVHRPPLRSFVPIAVLNFLMVLTVPFVGHHYLIDVIAGAIVAAVCIVLLSSMLRTPRKTAAAHP
jgi:membrane-associated phospholipid phosphatase